MSRLEFAIATGSVALPEQGEIAVVGAPAGYDLSALPRQRLRIVTTFRPDHDFFRAQGLPVDTTLPEGAGAVIVVADRSKALNRTRIAQAAAGGAPVIVDGAKEDGIDSLYRDARALTEVGAPVSKAHGKVFSVAPGGELSGWIAGPQGVDGFRTAPGVFSADGIDPGSRLLADRLPPLDGTVADLGAGWGYLARRVLQASPGVTALHLVEAEADALDCARENVADPRAVFHWADARSWRPEAPLDHVVTNPPFHISRRAEPSLGRAFIAAAAAMLKPKGGLWLVANRHLPYEEALQDAFRSVQTFDPNPSFKLFHATSPKRPKG